MNARTRGLLLFLVMGVMLMGSPVQGREISLSGFKEYGIVDLRLGATIEPTAAQAELWGPLAQTGALILHVRRPPADLGRGPLAGLCSSGVSWCFSFSEASQAETWAKAFLSSAPGGFLVELAEADTATLQRLQKSLPKVRFQVGRGGFDRGTLREIFRQAQPPLLDAGAFTVELGGTDDSDLFSTAKLMFDTMFDASGDIKGGSSIKIEYPPQARLEVGLRLKGGDARRRAALLAGAIAGAAITHVQYQNAGEKKQARIIRFLADDPRLTPTEATVVALAGKMLAGRPALIWPMAIKANGDPWDNPFFEESRSRPLVGCVTRGSNGYGLLLANTSDEPLQVRLPVSLEGQQAWSSVKGRLVFPKETRKLALEAFETLIAAGGLSTAPTPAPAPTPTPVPPPPVTPEPAPPVAGPTPTPPTIPGGVTPPPVIPDIPVDASTFEAARLFLSRSAEAFSRALAIITEMEGLIRQMLAPGLSAADRARLEARLWELEARKREWYGVYQKLSEQYFRLAGQRKGGPLSSRQKQELADLEKNLRGVHGQVQKVDQTMRDLWKILQERGSDRGSAGKSPTPGPEETPSDEPGTPDGEEETGPEDPSQPPANGPAGSSKEGTQASGPADVGTWGNRNLPRDGF